MEKKTKLSVLKANIESKINDYDSRERELREILELLDEIEGDKDLK